jgi:hypothetical protein
MSNAIPPSVTPPSPFEWPETIRTLTGISKARQAVVTCPSHGFTSQDVDVTSVMFLQVKGMIQINGVPGVIQQVIDANNFVVNINTSEFFPYSSEGVINIDTGIPPIEQVGSQWFNTPFQNIKQQTPFNFPTP